MSDYKITLTFSVTPEDLRRAQAICRLPISNEDDLEEFKTVELDAYHLQSIGNADESDFKEWKDMMCCLAVMVPVYKEAEFDQPTPKKSKFQQRLEEAERRQQNRLNDN